MLIVVRRRCYTNVWSGGRVWKWVLYVGKAIEGATVVFNTITRIMLLLQKNSSQQINIIIYKQREKYKFRFN